MACIVDTIHLLAKQSFNGGIFFNNMYIMDMAQETSNFCSYVAEAKLCLLEVWSLKFADFEGAACVPSPEQSRYIGVRVYSQTFLQTIPTTCLVNLCIHLRRFVLCKINRASNTYESPSSLE